MSTASLANVISEETGLHSNLASIIDQYEGRYCMMRTIIRVMCNEHMGEERWHVDWYDNCEGPIFGLLVELKKCELFPFCIGGIIKCSKCMVHPTFSSKYHAIRYDHESDKEWAYNEEHRVEEEGKCTFQQPINQYDREPQISVQGTWTYNWLSKNNKVILFSDMHIEELIRHIVNGSLSSTHPFMTPALSDYIEKEISRTHLKLCALSRD